MNGKRTVDEQTIVCSSTVRFPFIFSNRSRMETDSPFNGAEMGSFFDAYCTYMLYAHIILLWSGLMTSELKGLTK